MTGQRFVLGVHGLIVECATGYELWRARTLQSKEPGTMAWLQTIEAGEVVYDIGANIGLYSLVAAAQGAEVWAFEPHAINAGRLVQNIGLNPGLAERIHVMTSAAHDVEGFLDFHYLSLTGGSSGSQLGHRRLESGGTFTPVLTELKHAVPIDRLVDEGRMPAATRIKIDVDGNEPCVLRGMHKLLSGPRPHSVQVEMHPETDATIVGFMRGCGWEVVARHFTAEGARRRAKGVPESEIAHNAVFAKEAGA